jgi:hypothetical protein
MLNPGARLGPYQIESKLGEGGMGEVFRAVDTRLGRPVAIKFAHERFSARFEREARAISSLNHPHICTLYDIGPNYLVMELLEGDTIAARLKNGPLPVDDALRYALQIAGALADAHEHGVVHRDLKPGNVMLVKSGVKVLDFGLAIREGDDTLTGSHMVIGTPAYMAPEQREGKPADVRTDIYSFGCIFYEMLTGARATSDRKPVPSKTLEKIVSRCLETDPARRWQSAVELVSALEAPQSAGRTRIWMVPAAALLIALLMAGYFFFRPTPRLTDKDTIVLADFKNTTGDPVFDGALRQGLAVQLEQSPFLRLISDARIRKTLAQMKQPADSRLTPALAREICERTASAAFLVGSIESLGSQYVLGLRAENCHTGDAVQNRGQLRFTSAFDAPGHLRAPSNLRFATTPDAPPRRGPPDRRASLRSGRDRARSQMPDPFKEVLAASDEGEDRSPRERETLWLKRWIDRSPCERAPARSASGRCSSTRSLRVAHSARARWTRIACNRSRSPLRIRRRTSKPGSGPPDRPGRRDAIRAPS